jgi:hypothetical protein
MDFFQQFKARLDRNHRWPCTYMFKFIVPEHNSESLLNIFEKRDVVTTKKSRNGRYISVTAKCKVNSSEEVIAVYEAASQIKGILSL